MNKTVIIDNEPVFVDSVKTAFKAKSYGVVTAESGTEGHEKVRTENWPN